MANVLIVDDDPVSRLVVASMLKRLGHSVLEADGVAPALALLTADDADPVDLIICDYIMPDANGLELLASRPDQEVPFILLTGELNREDLDDQRVSEVSAYLTKPVASAELEAVVRTVIAAHHQTLA